jgi:hypothetical protein
VSREQTVIPGCQVSGIKFEISDFALAQSMSEQSRRDTKNEGKNEENDQSEADACRPSLPRQPIDFPQWT